MSIDAQANAPDAPVAKRIPSYMLPKKKSFPQKITPRPTPDNGIKSKAVKRNARIGSKTSRTSIVSLSTSVTMVDDAPVESKIEVVQSISSNAEEGDLAEGGRQAPESTQIKASLPLQPTLGKLFTEGGLERLLIEILENLVAKDLSSCLKVCKNTNTVIVKTSSLQVILRYHMYGLGRLRLPKQFRSEVKTVEVRTTSRKSELTSRDVLERFDDIQRSVEYPVYRRMGPLRSMPNAKMLDVQGNLMLLAIEEDIWAVFDMTKTETPLLSILRKYPVSSLAFCLDDKVVGEIVSISQDAGEAMFMRFGSFTDRDEDNYSPKHPDAGHDRILVLIPDTGSRNPDRLQPVKFRLYPGGLGVILCLGEYRCDMTRCEGLSSAAKLAIRLIVFNWHDSISLGAEIVANGQVVKVRDSSVKILDVGFLDDRQIVCSSIRKFDDFTRPCIDIYDIPQDPHPMIAGGIETPGLPRMLLVASFHLPPLHSPQPGCLWSQPPKSASVVSKFEIKIQHPSSLSYMNDQVMTFRLEGKSGGKSEKLQGVVLISKLREIMVQAIRDMSKRSADIGSTVTKPKTSLGSSTSTSTGKVNNAKAESTLPSPEPVHIPWKDWSDAVSIQRSTSTTILEPKFTQVASVARSKKNKTHALMMIRDYNQQMLKAPAGHMMRYLGHPTANYYPDEKNDFKEPTVKPFVTSTEPKSIDTVLFGHIKYGLGHRMRMVDLGVYESNTATSKLFWDTHDMGIVPTTPDGALRLHLYKPVYLIPEDKEKQGESADKEVEAETEK